MNSEFENLWREAMAESNEFLGETFYYNRQAYTGVVSEVEFTADFITGGELSGLGVVIVVPKTVLSAKPEIGEQVKANGKVMKISKVTEDFAVFEITAITAAV